VSYSFPNCLAVFLSSNLPKFTGQRLGQLFVTSAAIGITETLEEMSTEQDRYPRPAASSFSASPLFIFSVVLHLIRYGKTG